MKKIVLGMAILLLSVVVTARGKEAKGKASKQDNGQAVTVTADKLIGVWAPIHVKLPDGVNISIEFGKGGQMKVYGQTQIKDKDGKQKARKFKHVGTYKITDKGFTLTSKDAKGEVKTSTITITRLTDTEMATRNEQGVEGVYRKQK